MRAWVGRLGANPVGTPRLPLEYPLPPVVPPEYPLSTRRPPPLTESGRAPPSVLAYTSLRKAAALPPPMT